MNVGSIELNPLRHIADDELFVRQGIVMVPTAKAEAMAEPVREALARIVDVFGAGMERRPADAALAAAIAGAAT